MSSDDPTIIDTLRLASDLCIGVGAFFVTPTGSVRTTLSSVMSPEDGARRVELLARSCLVHPAAQGRAIFWNAEVTEEAESADRSLACVVVPVWSNGTWIGLLGVVDVWLPELDDEQRAGLVALARNFARRGQSPLPGAGKVEVPQAGAGPRSVEGRAEEAVRLLAGWADPTTGPEPTNRGEDVASSAEPFLGEVLDNLPDGLVVTRSDGAIVLVNQTFSAMSGLAIDDVLGEDVTAILAAGETDPAEGAGWMDDAGRPSSEQRLVITRPTGDPLAVAATGRRISSRFAGDCVVTLLREEFGRRSTDRGPQGSAVGQENVAIQTLLDNLDVGIVCCDVSGTVVLANRAARELQGLPADLPMIGLPFPAVTELRTPQGELLSYDAHPLIRAMRQGAPNAAHLVCGEDPAAPHVAVSARPLLVGGHGGAIAVLRDVTAEWEEQTNLAHHALHDPLTGVANRYLLIETLRRMLQGLTRRGGAVLLVFLDLDQFKRINDDHGHDTGDQVLKAVARRLQGAVRSDDIVARLGGDEFIVAHLSAEQVPDGDMVVARIRKVLSAPYRFGSLIIDVGVSAGSVSTFTSDTTPEVLLSQADEVMYRNKRRRAVIGREVVS